MGELANSSNEINSILLSRNTPVALVVGAAGFLGSNLVDGLLRKEIQVIGLDNFSTGKKENLESATKHKAFHLIHDSAQNVSLDVHRLDYVFITSGPAWSLQKVLNIAKKYNAKLVLVSSIDLYDKETSARLKWYKQAESEIAKFSTENKLNARVLRLACLYGPRMTFEVGDPLVRLLYSTVTDQLQKESSSLEFSSRALFIDDAVALIIKSMLSGSTAMKIFDGALPVPVKVSEIKQILMDPVWYDSKDFVITELPPWPTPNLEKTIKFLSWEPKTSVVKTLRQTIDYFKNRDTKVEIQMERNVSSFYEQPLPEPFKKEVVEEPSKEIKQNLPEKVVKSKIEIQSQKATVSLDKPKDKRNIFPSFSTVLTFTAVLVIGFGLIWPIGELMWNIYKIKEGLTTASNELSKGEFDKSLNSIKMAKEGVVGVNDFVSTFNFIQRVGFLKEDYKVADGLVGVVDQVTISTEHAVIASKSLYQGLRAITGELNEDSAKYFETAQIEFAKADTGLSKLQAIVEKDSFEEKLPESVKGEFKKVRERLKVYGELVQKGRAAATILPQITAQQGKKSYLVLLQNNNELRPTGGFIGSFAKVDFEGGKLKKLDVNDIYNIDGQLPIHVEPPKEIKEDLGQKDWFMRDSNWEPDFPTAARQAEWFYTKETGNRVDGVIALDLSAIEDLLAVNGAINMTDYNENITAENIFEKSVAHAEQGFFPGSQSKKNFLTALTNQLFNKLFFLPNQDWPAIVGSLGRSLEQKHLMFYIDDQKLFSYIVSHNWAGALPRPQEKSQEGVVDDFLAVVEANLGANKSNYYLDRNYHLDTSIGKEGEITHRLKINYTNRSPSGTWPGGVYKNRIRVYLPFGSKLNRVLFDGNDITKSVTAFADYGRTGYSLLIEIQPKDSKSLVLDYQISGRVVFTQSQAIYRLDVIKQAGTQKDPLQWKLTYPINFKLISTQGKSTSRQEYAISTNLSQDRRFEVEFKK